MSQKRRRDGAFCDSNGEKRLRLGTQRGDTAATCDATVGTLLTLPRNVPALLGGRRDGVFYDSNGGRLTWRSAWSRLESLLAA